VSAAPCPAQTAYLAHTALCIATAELGSLDAAFYAAAAPLNARQVAWLAGHGIPADALLTDGDGRGWPVLAARVERIGKLFRFATEEGEGVPALILVARGPAGEGVELVAWSAREGWVVSESGALPLLGMEWLCPLEGGPVEVHADVLAWLRAGRRGVVVVDQRRAVPVLRDCSALVVGDERVAAKLYDNLMIKPPKILVRAA
jgi:hypothetical protein